MFTNTSESPLRESLTVHNKFTLPSFLLNGGSSINLPNPLLSRINHNSHEDILFNTKVSWDGSPDLGNEVLDPRKVDGGWMRQESLGV